MSSGPQQGCIPRCTQPLVCPPGSSVHQHMRCAHQVPGPATCTCGTLFLQKQKGCSGSKVSKAWGMVPLRPKAGGGSEDGQSGEGFLPGWGCHQKGQNMVQAFEVHLDFRSSYSFAVCLSPKEIALGPLIPPWHPAGNTPQMHEAVPRSNVWAQP
jgi:hypothetical protein